MVAADLFLMDRYNLTFEGETTSQVGGYATRCEMARFLSPICASATERFFSAFLLQTMCRPTSRSSPCAAGKSRLPLASGLHSGCQQQSCEQAARGAGDGAGQGLRYAARRPGGAALLARLAEGAARSQHSDNNGARIRHKLCVHSLRHRDIGATDAHTSI